GLRDRTDDRGHDARPIRQHARPGGRRDHPRAGQGPPHGVGAVGAAAGVRGHTLATAGHLAQDAPMIIVVGIGADGMSGLAPASRTELTRATVIFGSPRQLALLDDTVSADKRAWPSPMLPALRTLL